MKQKEVGPYIVSKSETQLLIAGHPSEIDPSPL